MGSEVFAGGRQGSGGFGGEDEELLGAGGGGGSGESRGFFKDDVGVGAADTKAADAGAERVGAGPGPEFVDDVEGAFCQIQGGVGALEMKGRGELAVVEGEGGFNKASDAGGGVHVAGVGFERAETAIVFTVGAEAESLR